jgi:hypothetical protein
VSEINVFLGGAILALFITLVTSALQIAGVISVNVARILLVTAWAVAVLGVCSSMQNAPAKHLAIAALITGAPVGLALISLERWITKHGGPKPKLIGHIICLESDPHLDRKDCDYDCFVTLSVEVTNAGTPTAVSTFSLDMLWDKESHPGTSEPLDGYYVQTWGREPGDEQSKHAITTTALTAFPYGEEVTKTNYKRGWVRFSFGSLPPDMVESGHLVKGVIIELTAFDSKRDPHVIYKGTDRLSGCGKIARRELKLY